MGLDEAWQMLQYSRGLCQSVPDTHHYEFIDCTVDRVLRRITQNDCLARFDYNNVS
jgi:hypothetical protein